MSLPEDTTSSSSIVDDTVELSLPSTFPSQRPALPKSATFTSHLSKHHRSGSDFESNSADSHVANVVANNPVGTEQEQTTDAIGSANAPSQYRLHDETRADSLALSPFAPDYTPSLSDLLADLSVVESRAVPEYIEQWQDALITSEDHSIQKTYHSCMEAYYNMLPIWLNSPECEEDVRRILYRNYMLLREWGMAYGVPEGQLDQLPEDAEDLTETIFSFLLEISKLLVESKSL